ncbi:unnamed protein product [Fusarium graminearum]|uniref:Uncharacterized protein n=2 Tax=Gibberella zeae TaxID=5518 RepID=A0A9N8WX08_GIBZA|nr:unnamed protein product [Fusarium graminearum]
MESHSLISTEREALRKHADIAMAKWITLRNNLKILALSLLSDYNCRDARALLARDEVSILRIFFENDDGLDPESVDLAQADHVTSLAHGLFEAAGGSKSTLWDRFNDEYSDFDNQTLCGFMVDVAGTMSLKEAHAEQLYHAMLRSRLLAANRTPSFIKFLEFIQDCQSIIDPSQRRCSTQGSNDAEGH